MVTSGTERALAAYQIRITSLGRICPLQHKARYSWPDQPGARFLNRTFLENTCKLFNKKVTGFSPDVLDLFENYRWPGNVRQLRHEIERLVALTPAGELITPHKCSPELQGLKDDILSDDLDLDNPLVHQVQQLEIRLISKALQQTGGNRLKAAELLGITRQGLYKKMKRYQIDPR